MRFHPVLVVVALIALPPVPGVAQMPASPLGPGSRVRVRVDTPPPPRTMVGAVRSLAADTLTLAPSGGGALERIPLTAIGRLEVSRGRGVLASHVIIGALAGAAVGGLLAGASSSCGTGDEWCRFFRGLAVTGGVVLGGAVGTGVGLLVKGEKWRDVPLDRRVTVVRLPRAGAGVSLRVEF